MNSIRTGVAVLCAGLLLAACRDGNAGIKTVSLGESFVLGVNDTARLADQDLSITFKEVASDSRCPTGAQCITAGEATVVLTVSTGEETEDTVIVVGAHATNTIEVAGYEVTILALEPYPAVGQSIEASQYRVQMKIQAGT